MRYIHYVHNCMHICRMFIHLCSKYHVAALRKCHRTINLMSNLFTCILHMLTADARIYSRIIYTIKHTTPREKSPLALYYYYILIYTPPKYEYCLKAVVIIKSKDASDKRLFGSAWDLITSLILTSNKQQWRQRRRWCVRVYVCDAIALPLLQYKSPCNL